MLLQRMEHAASTAHLNEGDARWFPHWLSRCSQWSHQPPEETTEVNAAKLIRRWTVRSHKDVHPLMQIVGRTA